MKKITAITLTTALAASLTVASLIPAAASADASAAKERIQMSERTSYYGEVSNGQPNGRGTIKWGTEKQYSGDFVNGKRSGSGKYINQYIEDGEQHKVVYTGSWSGDQMNGKGVLTHKVTQADGTVRWHQIQKGIFKDGVFTNGYDVIQAVADPDFSFTYTNGKETLEIMGTNKGLHQAWKKGNLFDVKYKNGSVNKSYTIFPLGTEAEQRKNDADRKYLQSIYKKIAPHLGQFEALSKQVPLK
ncbi:hypothetical protein [Paenibacillus lactis]|uniref:MORN repeat-containing protein n=1 Tax=Paenibacillus lactis 154 TaxID=743719 RepID=G4H857_9BACL|nr:hypothetical protein [Paenibacillus lactis]EHB68042.1 MORN repeat-containing protein [Paenibacillus lactis 154]